MATCNVGGHGSVNIPRKIRPRASLNVLITGTLAKVDEKRNAYGSRMTKERERAKIWRNINMVRETYLWSAIRAKGGLSSPVFRNFWPLNGPGSAAVLAFPLIKAPENVIPPLSINRRAQLKRIKAPTGWRNTAGNRAAIFIFTRSSRSFFVLSLTSLSLLQEIRAARERGERGRERERSVSLATRRGRDW